MRALSALAIKQIATPAAPAAGESLIYPKSDGKWYTRDANGESLVGSSSSSDTGWITLPYRANYQAFNAAYSQPAYRKIGDLVYLRGLVTRNTAAAPVGSPLADLPVGFRPLNATLFEVNCGGGAARLDVYGTAQGVAAGQVIHVDYALPVSGYITLDGIVFSTT